MGFFQIYEKGNDGLRVCLFEDEIGRMENFGEKIGEKMNLCWEGKENFCVRFRHFPPKPTKTSLQNGEKIREKMLRPAV